MINKQLINLSSPASSGGNAGEEGLILHLDANDVDSYDGDGTEWVDITDHEYTPTTNVSEHFNTVTYTGASAPHVIDTVGFQPDLIWIKNRDTTDAHAIVDSVRGITSPAPYLASDQSTAEATSTNMPTSVQPEGFTITGNGGRTNTVGEDYVAWCFKAGGAAVPNTDGDIPSQVSANNDLGFSIVKYNSGTSAVTAGHGLSQAVEMVICKPLVSGPWAVWHKDMANDLDKNYIPLTTAAVTPNASSLWNYSNWGTTKIGSNNPLMFGNSNDVICYCFTSKRGVSKVGSYTGTSAAGNKVYTGFEPAFIIIKAVNTTQDWWMVDNKTSTASGEFNKYLEANTNSTTATPGYNINIHRDGFSFNGVSFNNSGIKFIYYAVAKNTNETELIKEETTTTSYSQDGTENFYNFVSSITSTTTSGTFDSTTLQDSTATTNFGDNGATEANNTINFAMSQPVSVDGFLVGESEQSYRGYTGTCKFYGSTDGNTYTLLGSTQQKASGFALNPTRTEKTATFSASVGYSYFRMTISNMERGTYGNIYDFIPSVADNDFDVSITTGADPVLHLDLGDSSCYSGSGTTVSDLSSNSHTVTTLAGVQEADFDKEVGGFLTVKENSDEGLTISNHADFDHTNGATYEGWVYLDPNGTGEETFLWRGPSDSGAGLRIYWHASYGWFPRDFNASGSEIIDQNNIKTGTSGFGRGKWYHLALTLSSASAATYTFYVDGNTIGSYTAGGGGQNGLSYGISLGKYVGGSISDLHGKIAQFRLYSSALTQDQIRQNYNFTKPSYPNGNDGTITGATFNPGGYFDFDGLNDEVVIPMSFSGGGSIGMWVNITDINANNAIATKYTTGTDNRSFAWYVYNDNGVGKAVFSIYYNSSGHGNSVEFDMQDYFTSGQWHHIMHTFSLGNRPTLYVDGVAVSELSQYNSASQNVIYSRPSVPVVLGQFDGSTNNTYDFNGKISDFKIYDKALTPTEVTAEHNKGQFGEG
mgnify:CR=1 FL=1